MIAAFPRWPSVRAGEPLFLHTSTDQPCTLRFVRAGASYVTMPEYRGTPLAASLHERGLAGEPWNWPAHRFDIPAHWRSGVYVAVLERATPERRLDAREARALFIVRARSPQSPILYNVPIFTYHAYNVALDVSAERTCLYNNAKSVTVGRPGGGTGGHIWNETMADVYDPVSPRQTFAHWDAYAIAWLESRIGAVDYACDLDLHLDAAVVRGYRLLTSFGHHEYWTDTMRERLRQHLRSGGNAAFFTGNTCWFRIRYDENARSISRIGRWLDDPEERTFGVSYRYGAGKWRAGRPPSGFSVAQNHWIYDGSGLRPGDTFGDDERLIGYECDGAPDPPLAGFEMLATSRVDHWPVADGSGEINGGRACAGIAHDGGELFVAGTVDWPRVLRSGDPAVECITSNVITRLASTKERHLCTF